MDERAAEQWREHEIGLYESRLNNPGPISEHQSLKPEERYNRIIETIQNFLPSSESLETPAIEIHTPMGNLPGMMLRLSIQRDDSGAPESAEAVWTYSNPGVLNNMQTQNGDLRTKNVRRERFTARLLDGPRYSGHTDRAAALNNLEHSVAAYQRVCLELVRRRAQNT